MKLYHKVIVTMKDSATAAQRVEWANVQRERISRNVVIAEKMIPTNKILPIVLMILTAMVQPAVFASYLGL